jgi:hypothetical protein
VSFTRSPLHSNAAVFTAAFALVSCGGGGGGGDADDAPPARSGVIAVVRDLNDAVLCAFDEADACPTWELGELLPGESGVVDVRIVNVSDEELDVVRIGAWRDASVVAFDTPLTLPARGVSPLVTVAIARGADQDGLERVGALHVESSARNVEDFVLELPVVAHASLTIDCVHVQPVSLTLAGPAGGTAVAPVTFANTCAREISITNIALDAPTDVAVSSVGAFIVPAFIPPASSVAVQLQAVPLDGERTGELRVTFDVGPVAIPIVVEGT